MNFEVGLSKKESEVFGFLVQGKSNKVIAAKMFISERTVKFHCANIYHKFGVENRISLLLKFSRTVPGYSYLND